MVTSPARIWPTCSRRAAHRALPAPDPAVPLPGAGHADRRAAVGQAREPPAGRRVQGTRRREPDQPAGPGGRRRGVITASTGNHGQSIAYAANLFGVRAIVCMPEQANPVKVESMRALGAEVIFHGRDFDDAREHCEKLAAEHGYR